MSGYMAGAQKKVRIMDHGLHLWREGGKTAVTARAIGKALGMSHAGVLYHWDGIEAMRSEIARYAVEKADRDIIPRLILDGHEAVAHFTQEQRRAWLNASA